MKVTWSRALAPKMETKGLVSEVVRGKTKKMNQEKKVSRKSLRCQICKTGEMERGNTRGADFGIT